VTAARHEHQHISADVNVLNFTDAWTPHRAARAHAHEFNNKLHTHTRLLLLSIQRELQQLNVLPLLLQSHRWHGFMMHEQLQLLSLTVCSGPDENTAAAAAAKLLLLLPPSSTTTSGSARASALRPEQDA
jgi:hypothetical protein